MNEDLYKDQFTNKKRDLKMKDYSVEYPPPKGVCRRCYHIHCNDEVIYDNGREVPGFTVCGAYTGYFGYHCCICSADDCNRAIILYPNDYKY